MLNSSSEVAVTILVRLFVLCTRRCAVFLVEFSVCLGFGIAKTAIIFKSWRFKDGLSAIQKDGLLFEFIVKTSNSYAFSTKSRGTLDLITELCRRSVPEKGDAGYSNFTGR